MKSVHIATVAVMAIAAFKSSIGEDAIEDFGALPEPQQKNLIDGIEMLVTAANAGPDARHSGWMDAMLADGWVLGDEINAEKKTHTNLVPFDELPESEQIKEKLLYAIVRSMSSGEMAEITGDIQTAAEQKPIAVANGAAGQVIIKYIGKRESHTDNLYGTGLEWKPGQEHAVSPKVAAKMLEHTDTYKKTGEAAAVVQEKAVMPENPKQPAPLPNLDGMEKAELIAYAQQHYGEILQPNMKVENMRNRVHGLIQARGR